MINFAGKVLVGRGLLRMLWNFVDSSTCLGSWLVAGEGSRIPPLLGWREPGAAHIHCWHWTLRGTRNPSAEVDTGDWISTYPHTGTRNPSPGPESGHTLALASDTQTHSPPDKLSRPRTTIKSKHIYLIARFPGGALLFLFALSTYQHCRKIKHRWWHCMDILWSSLIIL